MDKKDYLQDIKKLKNPILDFVYGNIANKKNELKTIYDEYKKVLNKIKIKKPSKIRRLFISKKKAEEETKIVVTKEQKKQIDNCYGKILKIFLEYGDNDVLFKESRDYLASMRDGYATLGLGNPGAPKDDDHESYCLKTRAALADCYPKLIELNKKHLSLVNTYKNLEKLESSVNSLNIDGIKSAYDKAVLDYNNELESLKKLASESDKKYKDYEVTKFIGCTTDFEKFVTESKENSLKIFDSCNKISGEFLVQSKSEVSKIDKSLIDLLNLYRAGIETFVLSYSGKDNCGVKATMEATKIRKEFENNLKNVNSKYQNLYSWARDIDSGVENKIKWLNSVKNFNSSNELNKKAEEIKKAKENIESVCKFRDDVLAHYVVWDENSLTKKEKEDSNVLNKIKGSKKDGLKITQTPVAVRDIVKEGFDSSKLTQYKYGALSKIGGLIGVSGPEYIVMKRWEFKPVDGTSSKTSESAAVDYVRRCLNEGKWLAK